MARSLTDSDLAARLRGGWERARVELDAEGFAVLEGLLVDQQCGELAALFGGEAPFRSVVVMADHGYGRGTYKYFRYPLPPLVASLRAVCYPLLAEVANAWHEALRIPQRYPAELDAYLETCRLSGQSRPTPLLLRYEAGDYNRLHRDVYGEQAFPLQLAVLLSEPGEDFAGGEFLLSEHLPRMQTKASVVPLRRGDAVVFAGGVRPTAGKYGPRRCQHRHGVSRLRRGERLALGLIFHDAQ